MRALRGGLTTTLGVALAIYGCTGNRPGTEVHGTAATRLKPATTPLAEPTVQQTVYVPVYSSTYLWDGHQAERRGALGDGQRSEHELASSDRPERGGRR